MPKPEEQSREIIDQKLTAAGWVVQDFKQLNLGAAPGAAVREFQMSSGPADYVLFVDRGSGGRDALLLRLAPLHMPGFGCGLSSPIKMPWRSQGRPASRITRNKTRRA